MKKLAVMIISIWCAAVALVGPVHAIQVGGEISISGGFVPADGASLADTTGIDFLEWTGSAFVGGTSGGTFTVAAVSGDFAGYVVPSPFILGSINDFSFAAPFAPVTPLWEIGGFSFDLLDVTVQVQSTTTLILTGTGEIYGNGFDRTAGNWLLTGNSYGSTFSWSATTVPEPLSLLLMAIGVLGLGLYSRRRNG